MKKIVLLPLLLLLWMDPLTYAQVAASEASTPRSRNIKLGVQFGSNLLATEQIGVWGEYRWNEIWGTRMGIWWSSVRTVGIGPGNNSSDYLTLPILLAARPGPERMFLLFSGIQLGYRTTIDVSDVAALNKPMEETEPGKVKLANERRKQLKDKLIGFDKDKTARLQVGLVAGLDYEFSFGLTMGLYGVKYLIDPGNGTCYNDWKLYPSWSFFPTIGYNLVRIWDLFHNP